MKNIIIFGSGGHASVLVDIVSKEKKYQIIGCIDNQARKKENLGFPYLGEINNLHRIIATNEIYGGIIAIGDNAVRSNLSTEIINQVPDFRFVNCIHPDSVIGLNVEIGEGNAIMAGAIINTNTIISDHCILNTNSSLDHDCKMLNFSSIAPNATVGGNCEIGEHSAIGIGSNILHNISVGSNCIIGGGSLIVSNTEDDAVYYGSPAKFVRRHELGSKYL